jgi:hypothetical protein
MENTLIETDLDVIKYLNSKTCKQIIEMLEGKNLIGKGFWGFVYKLDIKGHKVSAKIQPLTNTKTWDLTIQDPRNILVEIQILKTLSQYKITNSFAHFPYFYKEVTCDNQSIMFYEYYSSNLKDFMLKNDYSFEDFKSIAIQILISIYFFQQVTGYFHNDIHVENFLVNTLTQPIEQTYRFDTLGITKTIVLDKFYIGIWDFANAQPIQNTNQSKPINIDYVQFKEMFVKFIVKIIDKLLNLDQIGDYCIKLEESFDFEKYYKSELNANKFKWSHIKNKEKYTNKVLNSTKKSLIYWLVENNQIDKIINYYKKLGNIDSKLNLPTEQMLKWIANLPETLEQAIRQF